MIDRYIINDNEVTFYIISTKGKHQGERECFMGLEDFERIKDFPVNASYREEVASKFYLTFTEYLGVGKGANGKSNGVIHYIHRYIMDAKEDEYVDHINHNTLDNRRENLRISKNKENTKHRSGKNSNNKSGYRNVSQRRNKWVVQLQINGINTVIKKFPIDQLDEAGAFAKIKREQLYGTYAGNS